MKDTDEVFKVPRGITVPEPRVKNPTVPPGPVKVPLVSVMVDAEPSFPVTFKAALVTLIVSPPVTPALESAERVSVPTPSNLNVPDPVTTIGLAKVLPKVVEFRINSVLSEILMPVRPAPILKAPPETIVPLKLTFVTEPPAMVAPVAVTMFPKVIFPPEELALTEATENKPET